MIKIMRIDELLKIFSIVSILSIIIILIIILFIPPSDGYEISIYDSYPWYLWFLFLLSAMIGQIIILNDVFKGKDNNSKKYLLGCIILIILSLILISMPSIRGYVTYGREDNLSHIGEIKDIIINGRISENNFYPNYHIFTAIIGKITNIGIFNLSTFIPRVFPFIFLIGFVILSKSFLKKFNFKIPLLILLSFFFFSSWGNYFAQYNQSFLLLPIILFLYFKRSHDQKNLCFSISFIVVLIGYIFYHPLNSILLIIIFIISAIITFIFSKLNNCKQFNNSSYNLKMILIPVILSFVLYTGWYLSFLNVKRAIRTSVSSIFFGSGMGESPFSSQVSVLQQYTVSFEEIVKIGVFKYGILIIFGLISFWTIYFLIANIYVKKNLYIPKLKILFLSSCIIVLFGLTGISFFFPNMLGWGRYFIWALFFSLLLIPISIETWLMQKNKQKIFFFKKLFIIFIVFLTLFISLFSFYQSPLIMHVNQQVTTYESIGFMFFQNTRNVDYLIDEIGISQSRFFDSFHNLNNISTNIHYYGTSPPDHFGYNQSPNLASFYNNNKYLIISKLGKIQYPSKYPNNEEVWRFSNKDFDLLLDDTTVNRIYTTNFEFDAFLIDTNNYYER